ncbi:hypothetical protein K3495_g6821 [Podosphaera aphanis]|nr:hypothetical protein K3495_g6821 [Podosphaera aphanis]
MLLNTGQVSVAFSSLVGLSIRPTFNFSTEANKQIIALVFTIVLFLSGYILQQQTVRDLRAAIKPQFVQPNAAGFELPWLLAEGTHKGSKYWEARGVVDAVLGEIMDEQQKIRESSAGNRGSQDTEIEQNPIGSTRRRKRKWRESLRRRRENSQQSTKGSQQKQVLLSRAARRKLIKSQILYDEEKEGHENARRGHRWRFW